jgi:hypothetical protein
MASYESKIDLYLDISCLDIYVPRQELLSALFCSVVTVVCTLLSPVCALADKDVRWMGVFLHSIPLRLQ